MLRTVLFRERPQGLGTAQTCLDALAAGSSDSGLGYTCRCTISGNDDLRIITAVQFCIGFGFFNNGVTLEPFLYLCLQQRCVQIQRVDDMVFPLVAVTVCSPVGLVRQRGTGSGNVTGSIICPSRPSARIIAGMRYWSALSNASVTVSTISCTEHGAYTRI